MFVDDPEVTAAEAVIDNGPFGKRVVRFETGRLAKQAAGSAMAYLDGETVVLSATTVGKHPKDQFDFFPLTVDVEERQYAAGRIPGSFFRREGRAGTAAILACRLIDRPLRPSFVKGLRNEVQVVETILAIHPDDAYDALAINAASMSTQIAGLPFSGPVAGTRLALIDGQWVAFPRYSELERATFQMVVAGRVLESGDVAIMMVEAGATENAWDLIADGAVAPGPNGRARSSPSFAVPGGASVVRGLGGQGALDLLARLRHALGGEGLLMGHQGQPVQDLGAVVVSVAVGDVHGPRQVGADLEEGDVRHPAHGGGAVGAGPLPQPVGLGGANEPGRPPHHRVAGVLDVEDAAVAPGGVPDEGLHLVAVLGEADRQPRRVGGIHLPGPRVPAGHEIAPQPRGVGRPHP